MPECKVIVALDFIDPIRALAVANRLDPQQCAVKVGKALFVSAGPALVRWLVERGFNVFLDLKFHDIPDTVADACAAAAKLGVWMLSVHASGGGAMLRAARYAVSGVPPLLIGVTVLTSLTADADKVMALAQLTKDCWLDGVVCASHETMMLRKAFGPSFKLVTPGIRPPGSAKDDHSRVATPEEAIQAGSDYLVIGRPITQAVDPLAALRAIQEGSCANFSG